MIQANELRIGNWVSHPVGKDVFLKIVGIDLGNPKVLNLIEPIPLTPEILEACGFENFMNHPRTAHMEMKPYPHLILYKEPVRELKWRVGSHKETFLTSLHQLQNLYFALTGQELNYQP